MMWVARDKDNALYVYEFKPTRYTDKWYDWDNGDRYGIIELSESLFPEVKWEDEPKEVFLNTGFDITQQLNHVWAMLKVTQDELNKANQRAEYFVTKVEDIKKILKEY